MVFEEMSRESFNEAVNDPFNINHVENAALIAHETSHFIDHIATLNGQKMLLEIFNAFNAIESGEESNYWHIIQLKNTLRKTTFENYYKEYLNLHIMTDKNASNWSFRNTFGLRFDSTGRADPDKPIIFNAFKFKNEFIARIPLSLESLWEANAVSAEIQTHIASIHKIADNDVKLVSTRIMEKKYNDWIYTPELLTYSSATHIVSSYLKYGDLYRAFVATKAISSICLNMPEKYYHTIRIPQNLGLPSYRVNSLLHSNDPTSLFYLMVLNIKESGEDIFIDDVTIDTEKILRINGLPDSIALKIEIMIEFHNIREQIIDGPYSEEFQKLNNNGFLLFQSIGVDSSKASFGYTQVAKGSMNICGLEEFLDSENLVASRISNIDDRIHKLDMFVNACGY